MGFINKDLNIKTLQQCGGNVQIAIERLLSMFGGWWFYISIM